MDGMSMLLPGMRTSPLSTIGGMKPGTGVEETPKKAKVEKPEKEIDQPVDHLELSREERIDIAVEKKFLNLCDLSELAASAFVGNVVGTFAGILLFPEAAASILVLSCVGAACGAFAEVSGIDSGMHKALDAGANIALTPFKAAGKHIKNSFKNAFEMSRKKKTSGTAEAGMPGTVGVLAQKAGAGKEGAIKTSVLAETNKSGGGPASPVEGEAIIAYRTAAGIQAEASGNSGKKSVLDFLVGGIGGSVAKIWRAMPKFVYPSIVDATPKEEKMIMETLDSLPLKDVTSTSSISLSNTLDKNLKASGMATQAVYDSPIILDHGLMTIEGFNKNTVVHEIGHARDHSSGLIQPLGESSHAPWGSGEHVTDYAKTNRFEDLAESHEYYHNPELRPDLEKIPDKFQAMDRFEQPTLTDKILDRPEIREAGKKLAEAIDKVPHLRQLLQVTSYILGPVLIHNGADKVEDGIKNNDEYKKFKGEMEASKGVALTSGVAAPLSLPIGLVEAVIDHRVKEGKTTPKEAAELASKTLATMTGPAGLISRAAIRGMTHNTGICGETTPVRQFIFQDRSPETIGKGIASILGIKQYDVINPETGHIVDPKDYKLTRKDLLFMSKVIAGAALGGAVGNNAGFLLGKIIGAAAFGTLFGPTGALAGSLLSGFIGGTLGTAAGEILGGLIGASKGGDIGAHAGRLLDEDARKHDISDFKSDIKHHIEELKKDIKDLEKGEFTRSSQNKAFSPYSAATIAGENQLKEAEKQALKDSGEKVEE